MTMLLGEPGDIWTVARSLPARQSASRGLSSAWCPASAPALGGRPAKGQAVPKQIVVDEKAIAKGHQYMTVVCDLEEALVRHTLLNGQS